jgi:adenylylsulfate kinase-like enzyme
VKNIIEEFYNHVMVSYISKLKGIENIEHQCTQEELIHLYKKAADWYIKEFEGFKEQFQNPEEQKQFLEALETFNQQRA